MNQVFQLIQSLSKSEKRFFQQYSQIHKAQNSHYLSLYEALEKTSDYQEKTFLQTHRQAPFVQHFAANKAYLYQAILNSLLAMKSGKDPRQQAEQYLIEAEILLERSLYDQAIDYLEKGKALAQSIQHQILVLRFLHLERNLYGIYKIENHKSSKERIVAAIQEELAKL
jgi:hypothetical protein